MIRLTFMGVRWGVEPVQEVDEQGRAEDALQLNVFDEQSGILAMTPFGMQSVVALVRDIAKHLPEEAKKELAPHFATTGLITATADDLRRAIDPTQGEGPQG